MDPNLKEVTMAENKHWYILKVRSTFEGLVAQELRNRQFEVLLLEDDRSLRRLATASTSLFPGCLFCRFDLVDRQKVLLIPGVLWIMGFPEPQRMEEGDTWALRAATPSEPADGRIEKSRLKLAEAYRDLGLIPAIAG
jgi:hypothetical protein